MPIPKLIAKIELKVYDNATVEYHGPLNDVLFITDVLNKAQRAVLDHFIELRQKEVSSRIEIPKIILPGSPLKVVK